MDFPHLFQIQQTFDDSSIDDLPSAVRLEFEKSNLKERTRPGQTIAVGVGSRGINGLAPIVRTAIDCLKEWSLSPFITPAMGSHGGAVAEGQIEVLASLGITEESMGVPIRASMETVPLGRIPAGADIFLATDVISADHVMVINRVKPHTMFRSHVESGLCKMLCIGLGRQNGASHLHQFDLAEVIVPATLRVMEHINVLGGLAVTENHLHQTRSLKLVGSDEIISLDETFLVQAKELLPRIPTDQLDILVVEQMGKEISGAGMDNNVIGFWRRDGGERLPDYKTLIVLDLTDSSHGNAVGIGNADLTTRRLLDKVDIKTTSTNSLASGRPQTSKLPIGFDSDRDAIETAFKLYPRPEDVRFARIIDTSTLSSLWVSKPVLDELKHRENIRIDDTPMNLSFTGDGRLLPF